MTLDSKNMKDIDPVKYVTHVSTVTILGNIIIATIKGIAGFLGNSSALISDAIHSLSDVTSTFVVIIGVRIGNKKSDADHQYGHERLECIATILLAGFLMMTGIGIGFVGVEKIISGNYLNEAAPSNIALYGAIFSIFSKELMYWYTKIAAQKIKSDSLLADAWHHRSDAMSSLASLFGILGAQLAFPILDPLAAIFICFFIGQVSYEIFKSSIDKLTDKASSPEVVEKIQTIILSNKNVMRIDLLKTRMFANKIYVDIEIAVDANLTLLEAHEISENIHDKLEKDISEIKHCMIHVNPAFEACPL